MLYSHSARSQLKHIDFSCSVHTARAVCMQHDNGLYSGMSDSINKILNILGRQCSHPTTHGTSDFTAIT